MTLDYNTGGQARPFGFMRLLWRWKGSLWKLLWAEYLAWLVCYFIVSIAYRMFWCDQKEGCSNTTDTNGRYLTPKRNFEEFLVEWENYGNSLSSALTFVLGFYITQLYSRWWAQFRAIPWIEAVAYPLNNCIRGTSEEIVLIRRTIVRYANLASMVTYQRVSQQFLSKYPDMDSLQSLGVLHEHERVLFEECPFDTASHWLPLTWIQNIVAKARADGLCESEFHFKMLMDGLASYKAGLGTILAYKWVGLPLLYTQVVTFAVYVYFGVKIFSSQFIDPSVEVDGRRFDWGFPVFTSMQFWIIVGWLKAGELMESPFGHDDDDIELEWITKRNFDLGFSIVTEHYEAIPDMQKDRFWDIHHPTAKSREWVDYDSIADGKGASNRRASYADPAPGYSAGKGCCTCTKGLPLRRKTDVDGRRLLSSAAGVDIN